MSLALTRQPNGAAAAAELKTIRAKCEPCGLEISIQTVRPLTVQPFIGGGAWLIDIDGRPLCCPFCRTSMDGALYRNRV
jgi:hypothetical protein